MTSADHLNEMFKLREAFMLALAKKNPHVLQQWPIDISNKASQQIVRDTVLKGVEEMFESLSCLKNWKPHRQTVISEFDKDHFLEEFVDAMNYFISVLIMMGISQDELFDAYCRKDAIIHNRLKDGY